MARSASKRTFTLVAMALVLASLLVAITALKPLPLIIWNASPSIPTGFYWVENRQPQLGEIAIVKPPDWVTIYANQRGYLPPNVWLLKPVFALPPAVICRFGRIVFLDGKLVAWAKIFDRSHRLLPVWKGCRALKSDEVFLLGKPKDSFDSRYFGPVSRSHIVGTSWRVRFPLGEVP